MAKIGATENDSEIKLFTVFFYVFTIRIVSLEQKTFIDVAAQNIHRVCKYAPKHKKSTQV